MKKLLSILLICTLVIISFSGCAAPSLMSIDVEAKDITMVKGDSLHLEVSNQYSTENITEEQIAEAIQNAEISWVSSNEAVVTVDDGGTVTAVGVGNAEITVSAICGKEPVSIPIAVTVIIPLDDIAVTPEDIALILNSGDEGKAEVTVEPIPADTTEIFKITYTSSDDSVVTVDEDGQVLAIANGEADLTVTCGTIEKTVHVTVTTKKTTSGGYNSSGKSGGSSGSGGSSYSGGSTSSSSSGGSSGSGGSGSSGGSSGGSWNIPDENVEVIDMGTWCSGCGGRWDTVNNTCHYCDGNAAAPAR